jgi:diguanylate cyclase (GGDEF)-like protein/PAS domain S-box-containing protein
MLDLIQRHRNTGHYIIAKSAITTIVIGCALFLLQSRLQFVHLHITALTASITFERLASVAWLALALSTALLVVQYHTDPAIRWVAGPFLLFLIIHLLHHDFALPSLSTDHPTLDYLLSALGTLCAVIFAAGLPFFVRRVANIVREASRSRKSEMRLSAAAESSTDAVFMYDSVRTSDGDIQDFRFTFLNRNAERMLGTNRKQVIGKTLSEIFPDLRGDDQLEQHKTVVETGQPACIEFTSALFPSDGHPGRYQIQIVKLGDGIAMTITDITRRVRHKEELERALSFNKSVIASSPFSIIVTDKLGRITCVNPAAERLLWYQESYLLGHDSLELHDPQELTLRAEQLSAQFGVEVRPDHQVFRFTPEKGLVDEREWTYIRKDGSRIPVQIVVTALRDSEEQITGFVSISYDLTERKRADEYIHHIAHHDSLTGLPTRTLLRDRVEVSIERAKRSDDQLAILMVDLDNFKRVNDSLGHHAGDTVLCEISRRLKTCIRKSDTIARMGGDEFVVLLTNLRSSKDADEICQKLLNTIAQPIRIGKHEIIVTASIGIGLYPGCDDVDTLFKNADVAMYRVKASGRNGAQFYTPGIAMQGLQQLQLESALRYSLEAKQLEILYQPQVSFKDGRMLGVEALLRWNSPEFGIVGPNTFIPIAEETGLIVPIGEWTLVQACNEIAALQLRLGFECSVAVNISPRQFQQNNFPATVERALLSSGLKPEQLELEITEHLLMVDSEESLEIMRRVRKLGVRFAIDDFGTGFSNMGYITRFAVDRIKIDRSFITRCDVDENSQAVTSAIIALAHSLQIEVIAEGVESEQHVNVLDQMSCDQAQGYFYSRPLKLADLPAFAQRAAAGHLNLNPIPTLNSRIIPFNASNIGSMAEA